MELTVTVDYMDMVGWNPQRPYASADIAKLFETFAHQKVKKVFWRVMDCGSVCYHSKVATIYRGPIDIENYDLSKDRLYNILKEIDPLTIAIKNAGKYGIEIYPWLTLHDHSGMRGELASEFLLDNPQYQVLSRCGEKYQSGVLCYGYRQVRQYMLDIVKELAGYKPDGIYLCPRSHSRPADLNDKFGYNKPIVDAYKKRYGVDILNEKFDKEKWRRLRGECLTSFMEDAKKITSSYDIKLCAGVGRGDHRSWPLVNEQGVPLEQERRIFYKNCLGWPMGKLYVDWEKWVERNYIDELCLIDDGAYKITSQFENDINKFREILKEKPLLVWIGLWEWWKKPYRKAHNIPIRSPRTIKGMIGKLKKTSADSLVIHEALNLEKYPQLWDSISLR